MVTLPLFTDDSKASPFAADATDCDGSSAIVPGLLPSFSLKVKISPLFPEYGFSESE